MLHNAVRNRFDRLVFFCNTFLAVNILIRRDNTIIGRNIDDHTAFLFFHFIAKYLTAKECTCQSDIHIILPHGKRQIMELDGSHIFGTALHFRIVGRIVDQAVDMTVFCKQIISDFLK